MTPEVVWLACRIPRLRSASPQYDEAIAAPMPNAAPANRRRGGARVAPANPPVMVLASRPRNTVRSGAVFILSPAISAAAIATPPAAISGRLISRASALSCGSVPLRAATASAASGAMDRCPAATPIKIDRSMNASCRFACRTPDRLSKFPVDPQRAGRRSVMSDVRQSRGKRPPLRLNVVMPHWLGHPECASNARKPP